MAGKKDTKRMVYKHPSKNNSCAGTSGFVVVDKITFDYSIISESDLASNIKAGWFKTTSEALKKADKEKA